MKVFVTFIGVIGIVAFVAALMTFPVMWLWNGLVPDIFGLQEISVWQALGLNILCSLLFKNTGVSSSK